LREHAESRKKNRIDDGGKKEGKIRGKRRDKKKETGAGKRSRKKGEGEKESNC
jgi:hypothetical protein